MGPSYHGAVIQLDAVLTHAQTRAVIDHAVARGFAPAAASYPPSYRNNDRLVIDDDALSARMFERLAPQLPATIQHAGATWTLAGLNRRWRYCRYRAGQQFTIHRDGAVHEHADKRSFLTVMVYLTDATEHTGGTTRFYRGRTADSGVWLEVTPRSGAAVVFPHAAWHDGAPVTGGEKLIMRTDVLYERPTTPARDGHDGYVWSIAPLTGGRYASGGRDRTLRIWAGDRCIQVLREHALSVTTVGGDGHARLWTGDREGTLHTWRADNTGWLCAGRIEAHAGAIVATTPVHDGRFATGSADSTIALWTVDGQHVDRVRRHTSWVWALAWDREGRLLSGSEDGMVVRDDVRVDLGVPVRAITCSDELVIAGDATGTVAILDDHLVIAARWQAHDGAVTAVLALPGRRLASAGEDGRVVVWDLVTREPIASWSFDDYVRCLAVDDIGRLLCGGYDGDIHAMDVTVTPANSRQNAS